MILMYKLAYYLRLSNVKWVVVNSAHYEWHIITVTQDSWDS